MSSLIPPGTAPLHAVGWVGAGGGAVPGGTNQREVVARALSSQSDSDGRREAAPKQDL